MNYRQSLQLGLRAPLGLRRLFLRQNFYGRFGSIARLYAYGKKIKALSHRIDLLTGLGSRFKLKEDLHALQNPAIALINIDGFSEINDLHGHRFGDLLLKAFACEIRANSYAQAFKLYRLQGDEFALLCEEADRPLLKERLLPLAKMLEEKEYRIEETEVSLNITAVASFESDPCLLLSTAEMALKRARREKKGVLFYHDGKVERENYRLNLEWTSRIKKALANDKIVPWFQPIVNNHTGKIEKYEALIRLIDENDQAVSPTLFLPIAKQTRLYPRLTKTMIDKTVTAFAHSPFDFSLNLSAEDIKNTDVTSHLFAAIISHNLGGRLALEIVESEGIESYEEASRFIESAKKLGCAIAIDDFGTGYSNFEYLMRLNADIIKIDGSLIRNITRDANSKAVVETIVSFANRMGLFTVAEFVSDEATFEAVKAMGIDYSQGYLFGAPAASVLPPSESLEALKSSLSETSITNSSDLPFRTACSRSK